MKTGPWRPLSGHEWSKIEPFFRDGSPALLRGRPRVTDRACMDGILWLLVGGGWKSLPAGTPGATTCWRRLKEWRADGRLRRALRALPQERLRSLSRAHWEKYVGGASRGTFEKTSA